MRSAMPAYFGAVAGKVWPAVRAVVQAAVATSQFCEDCLRAATRALRWSRARVKPHKISGRCLAYCVLVAVEMPFSSTFSAAAGATELLALLAFYNVAEQGIGSRGHALAVGPSHCDNWPIITNLSTFGRCLECLGLEYTLM